MRCCSVYRTCTSSHKFLLTYSLLKMNPSAEDRAVTAVEMASSPAAPPQSADLGEKERRRYWWRNDVEEAKKQLMLALPMVLTNFGYALILMVSVMFAGHLGPLQLAASTLAQSWAGFTGYAFLGGLSGALETLCGQEFGAKSYKLLGIYLQASCIISISFSILLSIIWWYTEPILILFHQSPDISKEAAIYLRCLIPSLFAYGIIQNISRFLETQSVVWPLVTCSLAPLVVHIGFVYVLVHFTTLGYRGAPWAASITFWVSAMMLMVYLRCAKRIEHTWRGLSKESFRYVFANLKLALPSSALLCLKVLAFELLVLLAGLMPNSKQSTSVIAMCINTGGFAFTFSYSWSAALSTRVSNEIGAMRPNQAKHAMIVSLKSIVFITSTLVLALGFGRNIWASLFSDNTDIINAFSSMTPLLCLSIFIDAIQGILLGVSRGCGWQQFVMFINLGTLYGIGMPIAILLAFKLKLYIQGLWIGLLCGLGSQCIALIVLARLKKWTALKISTTQTKNSSSV